MANPTTNYGFVLPTSSDLVTDLPADFDVALQGVDTRLKALQPGTTLGDLAYSSATANTNTRLAIGTTGQVLTVAGGVPTWATPAGGGGKVLQVVTATTTTSTSVTTGSYVDTTLTASITPSSATSKVLIMVTQYVRSVAAAASTTNEMSFRLVVGAGPTQLLLDEYYFGGAAGTWQSRELQTITYLDSPATTSSTTYKTQIANGSASATAQFNSNVSTIILMEIGA